MSEFWDLTYFLRILTLSGHIKKAFYFDMFIQTLSSPAQLLQVATKLKNVIYPRISSFILAMFIFYLI